MQEETLGSLKKHAQTNINVQYTMEQIMSWCFWMIDFLRELNSEELGRWIDRLDRKVCHNCA